MSVPQLSRSLRRSRVILLLSVAGSAAALLLFGIALDRFVLPHDSKEAAAADRGLIKNRGFEADLEGWATYTVGPPARFEFDPELVREGRQALRVTAALPTDTGCYQEIMLKPGQRYRYSGWVRTRGLVPHGARCWGTFCVCRGGGNDLLAKAPNNQGDAEWTQMSITFMAPAGGLTRIYVMVSGWGPASGMAWFDDLKLVEVSEAAN